MDKAYYKSYYSFEREHWWFKARSEILCGHIHKRVARGKKLKILNVGIATGATTLMLQRFGEVTSLEYDQDCIDFVKDKVNFEIVQGSILDLPFEDNQFDLVCAFDVIEHVENDKLAASELARVCASGGSVMVTVPAFMCLWSDHDEINHHYRRYTRPSLQKIFQALPNGSITFISYFNFFLLIPVFLARKLANLLKSKQTKPARSDFESFNPGILNGALFQIMKSEGLILSSGMQLPAGVSILLHWVKHQLRR